jgi:TolB protein
MRTLAGAVALAGLLGAAAFTSGRQGALGLANAAWEPEVEITAMFTSWLRLAVPGETDVDEVIRDDVALSGGFALIDPRALTKAERATPGSDKRAWSQVGAMAVITSRGSGEGIHFELYDFAKGDRPVLSELIAAGSRRDAAHRFMNRVLEYYTGIPGVFGSRIAFVRTRRTATSVIKNVVVADMDGSREVGVTENRSLNVVPSLGPQGQVLFTSWAKRNPDLWLSARGKQTRISSLPGLNLGGVMSPDGKSIAVTLSRDGNSELYALEPDGTVKARLTRAPGIDGSPTWNREGTEIAFVSDRSGAPQIHRIAARGGGAKRVTSEGDYNQAPDWNQGPGGYGELIAYAGRDGDRIQIFRVDVRTGRTRKLTDAAADSTDPSWAPDGRMLAFTREDTIVVSNEDGANRTRVIEGGAMPDWGPGAPRVP